MYKCDDCGAVVEELDSYREYHDELDECPYEEMTDWDCICGGHFQEAKECPVCGGFYLEEESEYDWCQSCLDEYKTPDIIQLYIDSEEEFQREFYFNGRFERWDCSSVQAHNALMELGRKQYQELQKLSEEHPCIKAHLEALVAEYVLGDIVHFYTWLSEYSEVAA